jgi:hypothetical protein
MTWTTAVSHRPGYPGRQRSVRGQARPTLTRPTTASSTTVQCTPRAQRTATPPGSAKLERLTISPKRPSSRTARRNTRAGRTVRVTATRRRRPRTSAKAPTRRRTSPPRRWGSARRTGPERLSSRTAQRPALSRGMARGTRTGGTPPGPRQVRASMRPRPSPAALTGRRFRPERPGSRPKRQGSRGRIPASPRRGSSPSTALANRPTRASPTATRATTTTARSPASFAATTSLARPPDTVLPLRTTGHCAPLPAWATVTATGPVRTAARYRARATPRTTRRSSRHGHRHRPGYPA